MNAYIVLKVFSGYKTCADQPAGWHQYGPASANADMSPYSYTISPGFWKKGDSTPRLTRDPARWANQVAAMASLTAQFQLVTTFNEWGEGTAVESADEWSSPSGYGTYLDILHGLPVSTSPSPTATSSSPSPTSSSPSPTSSSSSPPPSGGPLVVIYMENKERSSVVGSSSATYQNALRAQGIDFTYYYGVTHPSLPNHLALGTGATDGKQGTDTISAGQLQQSPTCGTNCRTPACRGESMRRTCHRRAPARRPRGCTRSSTIQPRRRVVFTNAAVCARVLLYTQFDVHAMPKVSFIAPKLCNDEHDCPISTGDTWLKANVAPMLANGATVVLTYDEGLERRHQRHIGRRQHLHGRGRTGDRTQRRRWRVQPLFVAGGDRTTLRARAARRSRERDPVADLASERGAGVRRCGGAARDRALDPPGALGGDVRAREHDATLRLA